MNYFGTITWAQGLSDPGDLSWVFQSLEMILLKAIPKGRKETWCHQGAASFEAVRRLKKHLHVQEPLAITI